MRSASVFQFLAASVLIACTSSHGDNAPSSTSSGLALVANWAFVADFDGDLISVLKVDPATGKLSVNTSIPSGACDGPRYLEADSTGRFLFVTCQAGNK